MTEDLPYPHENQCVQSELSWTSATEEEDDDDEDEKESQTSDSRNEDDAISVLKSSDSFGEIKVENSKNIRFGSRTFFKGPVTINQILQAHPDFPEIKSSKRDTDNNNNTEKKLLFDSDLERSNDTSTLKYKTKSRFLAKRLTNKSVAIKLGSGALLVTLISISIIVIHSTSDTLHSDLPIHLAIVNRSEWNATEYNYERIALYQPEYVIIGHVSSPHCFCKAYCIKYVQVFQIRDYEETHGDIRFNFLVGGDGNIYEGRGWNIAGSHTKAYNNNSLGIAFIGNFNERKPTLRQVKAAKKLVEYAFKNNKISKNYKLLGQMQITNNPYSPGARAQKVIENWDHWVRKP